jgi:hypothetical protein
MVLQANPELLNLFADLYAENLPLTNTIEIKNRLKTIVPPQIIEAGKTGKMPPQEGQANPEQMAMQMQQQQMQAEIAIKQEELALKQREQQIKLEIEIKKLEREEVEVAGQIEAEKLRYMAETNRTETDASIAHANNLVKILTHKMSVAKENIKPKVV